MPALFLAAVKASHRMGHEGFFKSILAGMGNVVSAILMYVLQAAWLCQRLIDQDYRQNHGSRLKPLVDGHATSDTEMASDFVLPRSHAHKAKSLRHAPKNKRLEMPKCQTESSRRDGEYRKRRNRTRPGTRSVDPRLIFSQPYLESPDCPTWTVQHAGFTLRRAFSDINLGSSCSEFQFSDNNQNYLSSGNVDDATVTTTDHDLLRFIFTKGYVT